jgi:hypothetical protein
MCFCLQGVELDNRRTAKFVSFNFTLVSLQANMIDDGIFNNLKPRHRHRPLYPALQIQYEDDLLTLREIGTSDSPTRSRVSIRTERFTMQCHKI